MDLSIYAEGFTQHDLFGLFPGAPGGRTLRDTYGRDHLVTIASTDGRTTLDRAGVSKAALARAAGKSNQTIHAMLNPASLPTRRGGVRYKTAADLAKAFADLTGCSEEAAMRSLFLVS